MVITNTKCWLLCIYYLYVTGLASVLFAITIDTEDINKISNTSSSSVSITRTTSTVSTSSLSKLLPNSLLSTFQRPADVRPVTTAGSSAIGEWFLIDNLYLVYISTRYDL